MMEALRLPEREAEALRDLYWRDHGSTVAGLMLHHGIDPAAFLRDVHEIELHMLSPDPALAAALAALPGRRVVFTNGSARHAARVLEALGLSGAVHAAYRDRGGGAGAQTAGGGVCRGVRAGGAGPRAGGDVRGRPEEPPGAARAGDGDGARGTRARAGGGARAPSHGRPGGLSDAGAARAAAARAS